MQHAYTTPDYPPYWDDEDGDPLQYVMVFKFEGCWYRVYGEWLGDDWNFNAKAYLLDDNGEEMGDVTVASVPFWTAAAYAMAEKEFETLGVVP